MAEVATRAAAEAERKGLSGEAEKRYVGGVFNKIRLAHARATQPGKGAAHLNRKRRQEVKAEAKARISVRAHTYHGNPGYLISGKDTLGRKVSIFSRSQSEAQRMRDDIKAGREPGFEKKPAKSISSTVHNSSEYERRERAWREVAKRPDVKRLTAEIQGHADALKQAKTEDERMHHVARMVELDKERGAIISREVFQGR